MPLQESISILITAQNAASAPLGGLQAQVSATTRKVAELGTALRELDKARPNFDPVVAGLQAVQTKAVLAVGALRDLNAELRAMGGTILGLNVGVPSATSGGGGGRGRAAGPPAPIGLANPAALGAGAQLAAADLNAERAALADLMAAQGVGAADARAILNRQR